MLTKIRKLLRDLPGLKARKIASEINEERSSVSRFLHDNSNLFVQDESYGWSLVSDDELRIELGDHQWLTADHFESALSAASPLDSSCSTVTFVVASDCKILLETLARLLALCNQLVVAKKLVAIDFGETNKTLGYLDRIGFFGHLDPKVEVRPNRPKTWRAAVYKGNNDGVVELRAIDPKVPNAEIPRLLQNSFVNCAGDQYSVGALTVLGELFDNVTEHSKSTAPGFAALQFYRRGNRIQTVISDSGRGIVGTLAPILGRRYPEIQRKILASRLDPDVALLQEVFSSGGISQLDDDGRGLGLNASRMVAQRFKATISVRQENFELKVHHSDSRINFSHSLKLAKLAGTHICFDFSLDQRISSR